MIGVAVVPFVVEERGGGNGLLERSTTVSIHRGGVVVRDLGKIVIGVPPDIEWGYLKGLGDDTNAVDRVYTSFQHIDFWSAAAGTRGRVVFAFAGTGGEFLTWKIGETIGLGLVGGDSQVAAVIGVWPDSFGGSFIARSAKISFIQSACVQVNIEILLTHCPDTGP